jgi:hypothetical protein
MAKVYLEDKVYLTSNSEAKVYFSPKLQTWRAEANVYSIPKLGG